jgi:hypothetical protein
MNPRDDRPLFDTSGIWTQQQTESWLCEYPLPADFSWPDNDGKDRAVLPSNRIHKGYGFWLRTTPYFPGLFELIHRILALAPSDQLLTPEWLAAELNKRRATTVQPELL